MLNAVLIPPCSIHVSTQAPLSNFEEPPHPSGGGESTPMFSTPMGNPGKTNKQTREKKLKKTDQL